MYARTTLLSIGLVVLALSMSNWTPVAVISTHPDNIDHKNDWPEIAVDASGISYVTWQGYDGNDEEIYWVRVDTSGTPGKVIKISTHPDNVDNFDRLPQIAADDSGNSYIAWYGFDGNDNEIYWIRINASGIPGGVQKVSTDSDCLDSKDLEPQIAVDRLGASYIVWQGFDGNDWEIYWVKIDTEGKLEMTQKVSTHQENTYTPDYDPKIVVDLEGNSCIVWHGCDEENCWEEPGDLEIYWIRIDSKGIPGNVLKIPPTDPDNINVLNQVPQIAIDPSGNSYVVWSGKVQTSHNIYWVKIDANGSPGMIQEISVNPENLDLGDFYPQIKVDRLGNSYVAWQGFDGNDWEIYWVKIDASQICGQIQKVSNYLGSTERSDLYPQIAIDTSGNSYITWVSSDCHFDQCEIEIYWAKIGAAGKPERVQNISNYPNSLHFNLNPRIAVNIDGDSYITWAGKDAFRDDHIFFTALLLGRGFALKEIIEMIVITVIIVMIALVILGKNRKMISK